MDKRHFDQLVKGVRKMKRHVTGKVVRGVRVTELAESTASNPNSAIEALHA